jgi:hypothetical protein
MLIGIYILYCCLYGRYKIASCSEARHYISFHCKVTNVTLTTITGSFTVLRFFLEWLTITHTIVNPILLWNPNVKYSLSQVGEEIRDQVFQGNTRKCVVNSFSFQETIFTGAFLDYCQAIRVNSVEDREETRTLRSIESLASGENNVSELKR